MNIINNCLGLDPSNSNDLKGKVKNFVNNHETDLVLQLGGAE